MFLEDTEERSEIWQTVASAFEGVSLGNGTSLHQARQIDDCWHDDVRLRDKDPEVSWTELTDEKLCHFSDVFNFLNAESFRFYLPAFIGWVLRDADDGLDWSFCYAICGHCNPDGSWTPPYLIEERTALLTPGQIAAVRKFVEYETRSDWTHEALPAFKHFWSQIQGQS